MVAVENSQTNYKLSIIALWLGAFFSPLLASGVGILLPKIGATFHASALELSLVLLSYLLAQVLFNTLGGRFGDLWGLRKTMLSAIVLFSIFSFILGLVPNMPLFLVFRFLQGAAAAVLSSMCKAIALNISPANKRGKIMGIMSSSPYLGIAFGPLLGGITQDLLGWHWLFFIVSPISLIVFFMLRHTLHSEWQEAKGEKFDITGSILFTSGLALLCAGVGLLNVSRLMLFAFPVGFVVLGIFIRHQLHVKYPIIDVRMFVHSEGFTLGLIAMLINYASIMGLSYFFIIYLQEVRGLSPTLAGVFIMLQNLVQSSTSLISGNLVDKVGAERLCLLGISLSVISLFAFCFIDMTTSLYYILAFLMLLGLGLGFFGAPNITATLSHVDNHHIAVGSGLIGSTTSFGAMLSQLYVALAIVYFMGSASLDPALFPKFLDAMKFCLLSFVILNAVGLFVGIKRIRIMRKRLATVKSPVQ